MLPNTVQIWYINQGQGFLRSGACTLAADLYTGYPSPSRRRKTIHPFPMAVERNTEYSLENLFNVIDAIYVSGKAMIITTNLNLEELKNQKQLSLKRIYDRVLERCIPVCVSENDFRKDNRVEAKVKFGKIINGGKMDE